MAAACTYLPGQKAVRQFGGRGDGLSRFPRQQLRPFVGQRQQTTRLQAKQGRAVRHAPGELADLHANEFPCLVQKPLADHRAAAAG
jgi:hypothetical protein